MKDHLLQLIAHMRWADALFAAALIDEPASRGAVADADAVRLFAHVAAAEHLWYARIVAKKPDHAVWPALSPAEARDLAAANADLFERLVADGSASDLTRRVAYTNSAGHNFVSAVDDIVTHVTTHGIYHRGQIARCIRASGGVPPYTDFIQFVRRGQVVT